ncbi:uncharacterized protein EMH_0026050 [Eimeria mitis]|uniref:Uncharacterized protein n=1 Tax=Eimeria mitis TaxID=44415 RepID=U6KJ18_9EIME|nr:uncharacterized protein EMH_0026050 [Eimeria mitis]CDJ35438.1 hypothetical protein EMH_0026050 [Eimeria mitis]
MIGQRRPTRQQRKTGSEAQQAAGSAGTNESHQPAISAGANESHLGAGSADANELQQATGSGGANAKRSEHEIPNSDRSITDISTTSIASSDEQHHSLTTAEIMAEAPTTPEHLSPQRWRDAYERCSFFRDIVAAAARNDRDPRFQSQLWRLLCQRFQIKRAMSSSYHPQTDGQTERLNRTLEQMLRTYIQTDEKDWERLLPALELAYNTTSHSSTELSPFEVMIGQNPVTAADMDIIGDLAPTLTPPMTKLIPDRPRDPAMQSKEAAVGWLPLNDQDGLPTDIYEVDYILNQRGSGKDAQYLVKWRGAPEDRATWEPASNLTNCAALLRAWRRYYNKVRSRQRSSTS